MVKRVKFSLRDGMTPEQLLSAVKGKISGETQQAALSFEESLTKENVSVTVKTDKVRETAVVRILTSTTDSLSLPTYIEETYLVGINDEGFYYVHELIDIPPTIKTIEELLSWVNRADQGFAERVQGDILLQFIRKPEIKDDYGGKFISNLQIPNGISSDFYQVDGDAMLGNHKILTDGEVFRNYENFFIVIGETLTLQHPQHGIKTITIPKGTAALLAPQRGRAGVAD